MILTAALVHLASAPQDDGLIITGLRYLARHQAGPGDLQRGRPGDVQADGPRGDPWKAWVRERAWLVETQQRGRERCDCGSWEAAGIRARLRDAAPGTMAGGVDPR